MEAVAMALFFKHTNACLDSDVLEIFGFTI